MDRLSILLTPMTGSVLTGAFIITVFTLGLYGWPWVIGAAVLGFALSWPSAYLISRRIKRDDPAWDETRVQRTDAMPRPNAPEV